MAVRGRKTKFRPEYVKMLDDHMSEGWSFPYFAGKVRINHRTLVEWARIHLDFKAVKDKHENKGEPK